MSFACPSFNQPWQEDFLHHSELVDIDVQHLLEVLARDQFKFVERKETSRSDDNRYVQVMELRNQPLVEGWV
jgi:hypothetical protein